MSLDTGKLGSDIIPLKGMAIPVETTVVGTVSDVENIRENGVDEFLASLYIPITDENTEKLVGYIFSMRDDGNFSLIDEVLQKIDISRIELLYIEGLARICYHFRERLKNYNDFIRKGFDRYGKLGQQKDLAGLAEFKDGEWILTPEFR